MKEYTKLLQKYTQRRDAIIRHEWGQSVVSLHNAVVRVWNTLRVGETVGIVSAKQFGIKSAIAFLNTRGFSFSLVGKGEKGIRFAECEKTDEKKKEYIHSERNIDFSFRKKQYTAYTGEAIFSKEVFDEGTRVLLEFLFEKEVDLDGKRVADFGSGWGAIAMVLAREFPKSFVTAYEKDEMSFEATEENVSGYPNANAIHVDLAQANNSLLLEKKEKIDVVVSNPPFHSTTREKAIFFENAWIVLKQKGELLFVVEDKFVLRFKRAVQNRFLLAEEKKVGFFVVFRCVKK